MKYKLVKAACVLVLVGGLCCMSAVSRANPTEENAAEKENKSIADPNVEMVSGIAYTIDSSYAYDGETSLSEGTEASVAKPETEIETEAIVETGAETEVETSVQEESEYADLAIADVTNYVNVRTEPNTDSSIVGKIYDGAVAQILSVEEEEDGDWFQVVSGNAQGYIKAEFFLYGDAALAVIDDYVTRYATVLASRLNVRSQPDIEAARVGYINNGERVRILENQGEWLKVKYTENVTGFVSAEYVTVSEEFIYAKTLEEEAQELAELRALKERQKQSETQAQEDTAQTAAATPADAANPTNGDLRQQVVNFAMQFLGNKYIHGGQTLAGGTDCSGFTSLIYAQFGYSLSRTPAGQLSGAGRGINYSEAQPGDIICYGSGGRCTHVAIYIGGGQIIHSANSRKGVIIDRADYDTILGIRNVID